MFLVILVTIYWVVGNWVTGENSEYILTLDFKIHFHGVDFITHRQIKWDFKQSLCPGVSYSANFCVQMNFSSNFL